MVYTLGKGAETWVLFLTSTTTTGGTTTTLATHSSQQPWTTDLGVEPGRGPEIRRQDEPQPQQPKQPSV